MPKFYVLFRNLDGELKYSIAEQFEIGRSTGCYFGLKNNMEIYKIPKGEYQFVGCVNTKTFNQVLKNSRRFTRLQLKEFSNRPKG